MGEKTEGATLKRWKAALALQVVSGRGQGHKEQDSNSILQDRSPCHFTAFWHSRGNTLAPGGKQSACWPDSRSIFCSGSSSRARIVLHRPPHWSLYQTLWRKQKRTRTTAEWTQVAARPPPLPIYGADKHAGCVCLVPGPLLHRALSPTLPGPEKMPELQRGTPALQNPHPQPPPTPCDWRAPTSQHNQFLWFRSGPWHQSGHQEANLGCLWGVHLPGLEELLSFDFFYKEPPPTRDKSSLHPDACPGGWRWETGWEASVSRGTLGAS